VAAVPALLLELLNARRVPYDFSHPANTSSFLVTIVVIPAALAIVVGGVAAFLETRRGRATWTRSGRAGWVITAIIGALVGAAITSVLAGSTTVAGGVAEAPTVTGTLTVENSMFIETSLEMKNGEVLGLFVINKDGIGHAFDVDSLGIHVQLPANSTTGTIALEILEDLPDVDTVLIPWGGAGCAVGLLPCSARSRRRSGCTRASSRRRPR
jgi:hypothetical protein